MNARQPESASWTRPGIEEAHGMFDLSLHAVQLDRDIEARSTLLRAEARRVAREAKADARSASSAKPAEARFPSLRLGRLWIGWQPK